MEQLMGNPTTVSVSEVIKENKNARTLVFEHLAVQKIHPGQFLMVWIPGVDEIPMSVSFWNPPLMGITVVPIGEATNALASTRTGQRIGIRGPFGTYFDSSCKSALVVGGGIGMAPLRPLTYELLDRNADIVLLIGAKTKAELVYADEFKAVTKDEFRLELSTDDGSVGFKGLATDAAQEIMSTKPPEVLFTCGPELMMSSLHKLATGKKMGFQASLERFMKCGCGLCGTCAMDPTGDLVCIDGPVFKGDQLERITEYGKYHRDSMGLKKEC
ncbi:MAG: dihydroorotate dehydrogenase electron transfer subunit [Candidatus Thorarchaeota archaeon]|jgi:dihydroorotate dehydrogenase electron transfer subunit